MSLNSILEDILIWLSDKLCKEISKSPYDIDMAKRHYADYLRETHQILSELSEPASVFHIIPQDNAIEIVANNIYQNYPNIKTLTAGDKSQIYNTLRSKITEFFVSGGQTTLNPVVDITVTDVDL